MITFGEEGGTATPPGFESGAGTLALPLPAELRNMDGSHETNAVCRMRFFVALQG
jgi:hypothetical protein